MESIIKSFFGIFFILLLLTLGVALISSSIEARNADIYLADCVTRLQNSNLAMPVVGECQKEALEEGYRLDVDIVSSANDSSRKYARLKLAYNYSIPVIGLDREHTLVADIR